MASENQSLQQIIDELPQELRKKIMETSDTSILIKLQKSNQNNPDIVAVIEARIQNINYLVI